jgi:tripartite-type tricarboxylate transporter receptor subunit TctC
MQTLQMLGVAALAAVIGLFSHTTSSVAQADKYPTKPIRIVTGDGAGGPMDILTRAMAEKIRAKTGQQVIIENQPGGRQVPAVMAVKGAAADGYTVLSVTQNAITLNPLLIKNLKYNPQKDLEPVTMLVHQQHAITFRGPKDTNWKDWTFNDLVKYSKENPGKIFFGSIGIGSGSHLAFEWMKHKTGANFTHVPYVGTPNLHHAFRAGDIQLFQLTVSKELTQWYAEGFAKALGVPNPGGNPRLPGVPTFDEIGLKGYVYLPWTGWFVPAGTPKPVIDKIRGYAAEIFADKEFSERFVLSQGYLPVVMSPEDFRDYVKNDAVNQKGLLAIAGIKTE